MAKKRELIITCNAKQVQDTFDFLNKSLADIKAKMNALNEKGAKNGWTEQMKKDFAELEKMATSINNFELAPAEKAVRKFEDVLKNLAGSTLKDVKRALNEGKADLNKMAENDPNRHKLIEDLKKIADQIKVISGTSMSLKDAKQQLSNLVNTPTDKLEQGLERLKAEYASLSGAQLNSPQGAILNGDIKNYEAQMALNKLGAIPTWNPATSGMNIDQLKQEYSKLQQAYGAVANGSMYGAQATQIHKRMESITVEIKRQTDALKENERQQERNQQLATQGMETQQTLANVNTASYEQLERSLKFLEDRHKKLQGTETKRIQQSLANQAKLKARMKELQQGMLTEQQISDRVNNSKKYTIIQLQQAYDQLKNKLLNLRIDETDAIKTTQKQMQALQREIEKTQGKVSGLTNVWKTAVRNIGTYMGVFAIAGFVKNKISEIIKKNYELSDSIMNVRKVSGLAVDDINKLYANITKIDTRNSVNTLMDLAYQGGKLGIGNYGVEGLAGFVKAAEQVQMALGEEMGEEALPAMAKLTENMDLIRKYGVEEAMQKTASAIFQLYTSSVSTGTGIVDFAKRLMPVAKSAGVATDELLGLASATESSGLEAEKASTAFAKMFPSIYKNADAIEKFLNIDQGTIRRLYDQNQAMQAMVLVFDKMQDLGNLNKYPEIFKLLGSEGARMTSVMTAMANNVDMLRTHLQTSTDAFIEGTAVINEYNLQNASAAAVLERANNIWEKAFVNPEGVDMVKDLAQKWYNLSKSLTESETYMSGVKGTLSAIATVVGILIKILPNLIRALMFYGAAAAIRKVWIEFSALNVSINSATTGMARLNAVMKSNAFVLAGTAIAFVVTYLWDMSEAANNAAGNLGALEEAEKNAKEESVRQRVELKKLYDVTQDQTKSIDERKEALRKMVGDEKYKEYYENLANEENLANLAANAYRDLTDEIIKSARARSYANKITELEADRIKKEDEKAEKEEWKKNNKDAYEKGKKDYKDQQEHVKDATRSTSGFPETQIARRGAVTLKPKIIDEYEAADKAINELDKSIEKIGVDMEKLKAKIEELNIQPKSGNGGGGGGGGGGDNGTTAPKELVEAKKEAEKQATAVISTIEEYYRLQEAAANELAAEGKINKSELEMLVQHIKDRKDEVLLEARRAIVSDENNFEEIRKTLHQDLVNRDDKVSLRAIESIQRVDISKAAEIINRFDGSKEVYGLDSRAFKNDIRKNAAQNELNIQRRQAAVQQEIDKVLLQYQFVEQAQRDFGDKLVKLGLVTDGYDKVVQQLADGTEIVANTREVQSLAAKVVGMGSRLYAANPESSAALKQLIQEVMTDGEGNPESFASIFPSLSAWMKHPDEYKEQMRSLYEMMIQYEGTYYDKLKQRDDLQRKRLDSWWDHSDQKKANDKQLRALQLYDFQYNTMNEAQTMGFMMGLTNDLSRDPEVMREQAVLEAKIAIWKKAKEEREANLISEEVYQERLQAMQDQTMAYSKKVMENINNRISRIQNMVKPVETAAKSIGQKLGDMILNMESDSATWDEIWKNMALAVAESLMSMVGQYAQYQITKSAINKSEIADEAVKAQAITMLGISSGAAKTIGTLGWWGIALIPVITQLLMGLLTSALNTASKSTGASSNNTTAGTNTKLVSNMLTYDAGNIQHFIGQDGRVYAASVEPAPRDGLITHPIATTVQGQPALVAEKGPEIVLGRETTRAIMMNEPELIRYLANYGKTGGFAGGYRPFDRGNIETVNSQSSMVNGQSSMVNGQSSMVNGQLSPDEARTLIAAIATFNRTVEQMQQKGIPCYINKYGTGGLIDEVKSGLKFDQRYGG